MHIPPKNLLAATLATNGKWAQTPSVLHNTLGLNPIDHVQTKSKIISDPMSVNSDNNDQQLHKIFNTNVDFSTSNAEQKVKLPKLDI